MACWLSKFLKERTPIRFSNANKESVGKKAYNSFNTYLSNETRTFHGE